jgi:dipeptidyl aminopeptidase/acylaminoacyl peptidase
MQQLTKGEWNVREIHQVTDDHILMNVNGLHAAEGEDPYNKHVVRLDLKTLDLKDLTPENANHLVTFNKDFSAFVDNYSRPDLPTTSVLRSAANGQVILPIQKQDISAILKDGYTLPEVFCAKGRDGKTDIWGTIYRPYKFNPRKSYPVVEYIYAGPHDSHVTKDFIPATRFSRLLELGFIVVTIDGMGTDNRSKSFQDVAWRNLKDAGFPDRILWMQAAAKKYKYMNLDKVGIYGYSAGGQNTLSALLFHPEFYKVGVALCGCHDNRMDKIWWNEQWMGYPVGPWYSENSNVDNAHLLEGKLLIINGEMDDNVDPSSSLQVVSELVKNNKDFEQYFLPGHTHNLGGEWITRQVYEFFWRNCR